jgi:cephalosporin hydroxylase
MKTLIDIMIDKNLFYSEDKKLNEAYTDKARCHSYVENFYQKEFMNYQDKNVRLLEIGIQNGGSIELWAEFFSNYQEIVGVDITPERLDKNLKKRKGVNYYFQNAYDTEIVNKLEDFDIIIDDGPHTIESQLKFIELYLPKLKENGLLIIEDIQEVSWFEKLNQKVDDFEKSNNFSYLSECLDLRNTYNRYDDLMFIVRKNLI